LNFILKPLPDVVKKQTNKVGMVKRRLQIGRLVYKAGKLWSLLHPDSASVTLRPLFLATGFNDD
jgi:hypothetical protein